MTIITLIRNCILEISTASKTRCRFNWLMNMRSVKTNSIGMRGSELWGS